jgi:hypothetical protein
MGDSALTRKKLFWMLSLRKLSGPRYLRGSSEVCRASPRMYRGREVEDVEVAGLPLTVGLRMENIFAERETIYARERMQSIMMQITQLSDCRFAVLPSSADHQ